MPALAPSADELRAVLRSAMYRLQADLAARGWRLDSLTSESLGFTDGGTFHEMYLHVAPLGAVEETERAETARQAPISTPSDQRLTPIQEAILAAVRRANVPVVTKQLARLAGYPYNSRFRGECAELARRGLIIKLPDGYVTPGS